jgi:hypothetical protein
LPPREGGHAGNFFVCFLRLRGPITNQTLEPFIPLYLHLYTLFPADDTPRLVTCFSSFSSFKPTLLPAMSAILSADDLNDFISPGVACIKPVETLPAAKVAAGDHVNHHSHQRNLGLQLDYRKATRSHSTPNARPRNLTSHPHKYLLPTALHAQAV